MLEMFKKPETTYPINPRYRAYGKARIDIAKRAETREDWDQLWKKPTHPFPFSWGSSWKQCIEYKVADFPAEVGFFIDILGFPVNAFDPDYAMFTSPSGDFFFSVVPTRAGETATPKGAIRLQFMVQNIVDTAVELERRGVKFDQMPARVADNSAFLIGTFHTPHGIGIDLWGFDSRIDRPATEKRAGLLEEVQEPNVAELVEQSAVDQTSKDDQLLSPEPEQLPEDQENQGNSGWDQEPADEVKYLSDDEL